MIIIAAMTEDHVIGSGEGMPWDVPEEYAHFLRSVADQTVIIGRRSFEIFGPDLGCRHTLVVASQTERALTVVVGVEVVANISDAIVRAESLGRQVFSAGGASIYKQTMAHAAELHLSTIKGQFDGDVYFP
jgi:dihydrofolate reductase